MYMTVWLQKNAMEKQIEKRFKRAVLTLEGVSLKKLHEGKRGRGSIGSLPSTFDTIHPTDLIIGTYNELSLYFQLIKTTWCLIGFHGNHSQRNDVKSGRHLGFSNFQIVFIIRIEH